MSNQSAKIINIISTGTWLSSSNIGDNAIFCGILDTLNQADFTVLTSDPNRVRSIYQVRAYSPKQHPIQTILSIIKSDYLLFTGGTPLFNDPIHMAYYASLAVLAKLFRKSVIIFGVSYRKAKGSALLFIKIILRVATFVGARELETLNAFYKLVNDTAKVKFFPDPAFFLKPTQISSDKELVTELGLTPSNLKIGVCMRSLESSGNFQDHHYSNRFSDEMLQSFYLHMARFIEHVVEADNTKVFLLPMHIHHPDDDRKAANQVYRLISKTNVLENVITINEQLTPREMKWLFSRLHLVVGIRFHSIILSASVNTPVISIEYAKKNQDLLQLLDLSQYSSRVEDVTNENLITRYNQIKEHRSEIQDHLETINKHFQKTYLAEVQKIIPELTKVDYQ